MLHDPKSGLHQEIFGITLDPDFPTNHYVYAFATSRQGDTVLLIKLLDLLIQETRLRTLLQHPERDTQVIICFE